MLRPLVLAALILVCDPTSGAWADESAGAQHSVWRSCLQDAYASHTRSLDAVIAADVALSDCRASESAYLAALASSPLVDAEDVGRIRPTLIARARDLLLAEEHRPL